MDYPDLVALRAVIDSEPSNAAKTDAEVRAWLVETTITRKRLPLLSFVAKLDEWSRLRLLHDTARRAQALIDAQQSLSTIQDLAHDTWTTMKTLREMGQDDIDVSPGAFATRIAAFVSNSFITQAQADELSALAATELTPRWRSEGLPRSPMIEDVTDARAL